MISKNLVERRITTLERKILENNSELSRLENRVQELREENAAHARELEHRINVNLPRAV
jgi:uncharacterized protein YdhG (YjbR/CyaY superfamily)